MPFVYNENGAAREQPSSTTSSQPPPQPPPVPNSSPSQSHCQGQQQKSIQQILTEPTLRNVRSETDRSEDKRKKSVNHVVPFLMKQHAKTLLSIQELQERVASLEELSCGLHSAMEGGGRSLNAQNPWQTPQNSSQRTAAVQRQTAALKAANNLETPNYNSQVVQSSKRSDCSASESDKQDSGLEVDCSRSPGASQSHTSSSAQSPSTSQHQQSSSTQADQLLELLDQICEKGNHLRDYASTQHHLQQLNSDLAAAGMGGDSLIKENLEMKRLLTKLDEEKKAMKDTLRNYENQLHRLQGERMAYEDKLSAVYFEKRQLESHVRALHVSCVQSTSMAVGGSEQSGVHHIHGQVNPGDSSHLSSLIESPSVNEKVSRVLQTDNPLELQRQLIEHIMEKDALQERLQKIENTWQKRHLDWKKTEEALQSHVDDLMGERDECISALRKNQVDLRRLRSRLTFLENAIHKFDAVANHQLHDDALDDAPLPPWLQQSSSPRMVQSYHNLAIQLGERKSPCHSLPPRVGVNQAQNAYFRNEAPASHMSVEHWPPLMSVNDELSSQVDQICSEFDPLSDKDPPPVQGNDDYDSLDLSMPLQPTKLHNTFT